MNTNNTDGTENKIYCVSAISLEEISEEKMKHLYEIHKVKYNKPNLSYEDFLSFKKSWKEDKYIIDSFISSYHFSKEEAISFAKKNIGDINECGSYEYAGVSTIYVGHAYHNAHQNKDTDFLIYKYNREIDEYEPLDEESKEYKAILHHLWGFI